MFASDRAISTRDGPRSPHNARHGNQRGFTLLEVVVALAIISLVAISALALVRQQVGVAASAQQTMRAQLLASEKLSMLRLIKSYELQSLPDTIARGRFMPPNSAFSWRVTSTPVVNENALNDVRIEIDWRDGSYIMRTRLYRPSSKDTM